MILGMSLQTFTTFHVIISLIGIATGLVVMFGMWKSMKLPAWTAIFLVTTIATSVTGFMFPFTKIGPPHIFGVISLVVLAFTLVAYYGKKLAGAWRWIYVVTALVALYLNCFVGVVQTFLKIPAFHQLAPQGNEPPFAIAQGILLLFFVAGGYLAVKKFRPTWA
jgi:amino acid transporter